jgi:uncharacterized protein (TIGR02271 family)
MARKMQAEVHGEGGLRGTIADVSRLRAGRETRVEVRLDDGRLLILPAGALIARPDGGYDLLLGLAELDALAPDAPALAGRSPAAEDGETVVVPVVRESLKVGKRTVETGKVVVRKVVRERVEDVDEPLLREEVEVRRVPVGKVVREAPRVREEDGELVVPVVEEVLVVQKRLFVREELRIRKTRRQSRARKQVTLRSEEAQVERRPAD